MAIFKSVYEMRIAAENTYFGCQYNITEYFLKFSVPWPKILIWKLAVISEYILL